MFEKILLTLDGSEFARAAVPHARALAEKFHATVVLREGGGGTPACLAKRVTDGQVAPLVAHLAEPRRLHPDQARPAKPSLKTEAKEGP